MSSDAAEQVEQSSKTPPATTLSTDATETSTPVPQPKAQATCGVCNANVPKYKCPRCYMPYCSVICNKKHRDNHPPDPEPDEKTAPPKPSADPAPITQSDPNNPFRVLDHSDKLKLLFTKYPGLPDQLRRIHDATLPPKPAPGSKPGIPESMMQGIQKKETWNHDMGIKNGKAALRRAKSASGEEGEGVREYYELILHMMSESNKDTASQYVQQQLAQEDTKLIERLLAQEKR